MTRRLTRGQRAQVQATVAQLSSAVAALERAAEKGSYAEVHEAMLNAVLYAATPLLDCMNQIGARVA